MKNLDEQINYIQEKLEWEESEAIDSERFQTEREEIHRKAGFFDEGNPCMLAQMAHNRKCADARIANHIEEAEMFRCILESLTKLKSLE
jgi:hypothetical protein